MATATLKKYQSLAETEKKFSQLLLSMKKSGDLMLPAERVLCEQLYCSRETIRRLLKQQEADGVIVKKGRSRSLSMKAVAPTSIGSFAFIANGQGMVNNQAWNKLWTALQPLAEAEKIYSKLTLIPHNATEKGIDKLIAELPEILILTTIDNKHLFNKLTQLSGKTIITTEEHYHDYFNNIIAMDNYQAGFINAAKLAEHGYRKPALICDHLMAKGQKFYRPYERRIQGFIDGCRKHGLPFTDDSKFMIHGSNYRMIVKLVKSATEIVKSGYDSVFLHTDHDIGFLYEALAEECAIPQDIGLVTVNSFDTAVLHNPPVSSASHGTDPVANEIIKQIKTIIRTGKRDIGEIMVKPTFHEGATLK